jgi:cyclophilin family peptidyl-prolyl cis-trans isomerase
VAFPACLKSVRHGHNSHMRSATCLNSASTDNRVRQAIGRFGANGDIVGGFIPRCRMMNVRIVGAAALCAALLSQALAQNAPGTAPPGTSTVPPELMAEFNKQVADWKDLQASARELQQKYQKANSRDREALTKQFDTVLTKSKATLASLSAASERAYLAAPNQNKDVTDYLLFSLKTNLGRDAYEEGLRLARTMIDNNYPDREIFDMAGVAAYMSNDFDTAEKYFTTAAAGGALSSGGKELLAKAKKYQSAWQTEKTIREAEAKANDLPRVKFSIVDAAGRPVGDVVLELFENEAPNTVANFISLVEKKFYDGLKFHRVLSTFMAQGGDPKGDGSGGPGYSIACECYAPNARKHFRGSLSMAHAGKDTGGSQFFITFVPTDNLDGVHTAFGRVVEGMDVLSKIQRIDPNRPGFAQPDKIASATVIRKRPHKYEPKKLEATKDAG